LTNYDREQTIIEWLREYEAYRAGIENLKNVITDVAEEGIGISYDKDPSGSTNKFNSIVENAVLKIDRLKIEQKIKSMTNILNTLDRALDSLTEAKREIIINRCMKGQYYYQFCHKLYISERSARRLKKEALQELSIAIFGAE